MGCRVLQIDTAQGTTHTNSTDEAVLASYSAAANFFQPGKTLHLRGYVRVLDNNSTDTLTVRVRVGGTTLTGTAIATSTAVDVADDDICAFDIALTCRDADDSGTLACSVFMNDPDASGQGVEAYASEVGSLDFTAELLVEVTGDWSVAHADNQVASQQLIVTEIVTDL